MESGYADLLSQIKPAIFFDKQNIFYADLTDLITENVLAITDFTMNNFLYDYKNYIEKNNKKSYPIKKRKVKTLKRINEKKKRNIPDIFFKVNSDLCAFTINCDVHDIKSVINNLQDFVATNNGFGYIRNDIWLENNLDIVAYYFCYIPKYNFIMEFQIGHPFASYVFSRDSYLRDYPNSLIDLWKNNFYTNVKNHILGISNINITEELTKLYDETEIEPELLNIINNIKN